MEQPNWKEINPGIWKAEKDGDTIEGVVVSKETKEESNALSARYTIDTKEGIKIFWGSTILDDRMRLVKIGNMIKVTFKGKKQNKKGQDVNIYKVEVADNI